MAHSKSAKKRIRQNIAHRLRNRRRKSELKDVVRRFDAAIAAGGRDQAAAALKEVYRGLDKVAAAGTIHKNAAARKKARLARRLNKLSQPTPPAG